jgi:aryl-alcohol dehydrogenase-like predicted oxidoreductase
VKHLEENTAAAGVQLTDAEFRALDAHGRETWQSARR